MTLLSFRRQNIQKTTNENIRTTSSLIKKLNSIVKFSSTEKNEKIISEKIISEFHAIVQKFLQVSQSFKHLFLFSYLYYLLCF